MGRKETSALPPTYLYCPPGVWTPPMAWPRLDGHCHSIAITVEESETWKKLLL